MLRPFLILSLLLAAPAARAAEPGWRTSWAAPPAPPMAAAPNVPPERVTPFVNDQTVVQTLRLTAGGSRLRLRLSNEYGAAPLAIGHARVVLLGADGKPTGTGREVTFGGAATASIPAHAPLLSDPVALKASPLSQLQVRLYLPGSAIICTCHALGLQDAALSPTGDFTDRDFTPKTTVQSRPFLSAVEVEGGARGPVIVAFGDSITDGYKSTVGANRRWPDLLAERLAAKGVAASVANAGISGNRVLSDGVIAIFGESALSRFDRDVLSQPGTTHLVVLEGVNDMGGNPTPTAEAIIGGYRQMIARAHAHGIKVIFATVLPYKGAAYFRPAGETVRVAVNAWIRTNREADGLIDFDKATRDPAEPDRMLAALQSGDWLHPNDAGYRAMGEAIDLRLFR